MLYTNHESFLSELSKLFESGRQSGKSVWITMKRYDGRTTRNPRKPNDKPKKQTKKGQSKTPVCQGGDLMPNEYKCLIRARLGDRKISAAIGHKDMNKFQLSYSNLIKGNIYGSKKQKSAPTSQGTSSTAQPTPSSTTTSSKGSSSQGK